MNILDVLNSELKNKNYTIMEKARYLYLRVGELFSYDTRYHFLKEDDPLKEEIKNLKINLEDVTTRDIVCFTVEREVYSKLLKELLQINAKVYGRGHVYTSFIPSLESKRLIKSDLTASSDNARIKMNLNTINYTALTGDYNFKEELKIIDKNIGYIKEEYRDSLLNQRFSNLYQEFLKNGETASEYSLEYLIYKIYTVKEIFDQYNTFINFSDAQFCISYLINNYLGNYLYDKEIRLFDNSNSDNWKFYNIYIFNIGSELLYFVLKEENNEFCFYEISKEEAINYAENLEGTNKRKLLSL